ncbi:MAG TPA: winged helix-turn-helix domain-containing protein [Ktedonobacterales bacterium]
MALEACGLSPVSQTLHWIMSVSIERNFTEDGKEMSALDTPAAQGASGFLPDRRSVAPLLLGPACWHEPALARMVSQGKEILLTPRENALLLLLLSAPYEWHKTGDLAALLGERLGMAEVSLQSVRQTMLGLRRKLDSCAVSSDLLRCRPGHGYGIFPPTITDPLS